MPRAPLSKLIRTGNMGLLKLLSGLWRSAKMSDFDRKHLSQVARWKADGGEELRYRFPELGCESVVIDLGGYEGSWAERLTSYYNVHMHVFEAHPDFASALQKSMAGRKKTTVHPVALASANGTFSLTEDGDGSRADATGKIVCKSVEAKAYLTSIGVENIDLLKINIEGGEYDILPHLIDLDLISNVKILQVQFHRYSEADERARDDIIRRLAVTHERTWSYDFVWEEWRLKSSLKQP
jgi:FkbM family methyltransferase